MPEYIKPITKQCTQKILDQMNNSFCIIKDTNEICFFTKINYRNKDIPVMVTNFQIINYIANNKSISVYINNDLQNIQLKNINYFNSHYDLAIIQIKENENNKINYLELDKSLYEEKNETIYENESIYAINHNNKNDINVTYSIIYNIHNSEITHSNFFKKTDNISLIFNLSNNKLLGINKSDSKKCNQGIIFNLIINEFIDEYKKFTTEKKKVNEINIMMNIEEKDVKNKIYFLNKNNKNKNFDELNDINAELFIDNKKHKYQNYFIPQKVGKYNIKLKFSFNLTDCSYMFSNCEKISDINIKLNANYITSMKSMFHKCKNLKLINFLSFNAQNVVDVSDMFSFCESLNNLDLTSFNSKNTKNMSYMLYYCYNLTDLNLFPIETKNTVNMDYMFDMCSKLKKIPYNIKKYNSLNKYPNEIELLIRVGAFEINEQIYFLDNYDEFDEIKQKKFSHNSLKELNKANTELYINDKKYEYKKYFIPERGGEYNIKLKFNINLTDCSYMFSKCEYIYEINFIRFNTTHITNMYRMFYYCNNLNNLNLSTFDTKNVTDISCIFSGCENLSELDISSFDTENVINMSYMFYTCKNLSELDLSGFDTKNVKNMKYMFFCCENLYNLDLSSFNTKNVRDMKYMFSGCQNLNDLDLTSFDTKSVIDMDSMFCNCETLNYLDLSSFYTKNVINMNCMFSGCENLEDLNISSFDTKNVINMGYMFFGCGNLINLDITFFDIKNLKNVEGIFFNCPYKVYESNLSIFKNFDKKLLTGKSWL